MTATARVLLGGRLAPGQSHEQAQYKCEQLAASIDSREGLRSEDTNRPDVGEFGIVVEANTAEELAAWLRSDAANAAMRQLTVILGDPPGLTLDHWQSLVGRPVSAVVTHRLDPKSLSMFIGWQAAIAGAELVAPGFVGAEHHPPRAGVQDDWTIVIRFETTALLQAWLASSVRRDLLSEVEDSVEDLQIQELGSSWVGWFDASAKASTPSWKQATAVLVALYPTVVVLAAHLSPRLGDDGLGWPPWSAILVNVLVSTVLLNWVLIPLATRALRPWLAPTASARTTARGAAAAYGFVGLCALVTALLW